MSRVERLRQQRKKRWITIGIVSGVLCIGLIIWYYIIVQLPMWKDRDEVRSVILSESELALIERVHKFVTEDVYHVAIGKTEEDEELYVALSEDGVTYTFQASEGISRDDLIQLHKQNVPGASIVRVMPGVWRGSWVWEVFYRMKEDEGERSLYDYYDMTNGELLETYRLRIHP